MEGTLTRFWQSADSPLTCPFRTRRDWEGESKREKCVEDKYDKFEAFFRYFCNLMLNPPRSMSTAKQCNAKNSAACFHFFFWAGLIGYIVSATKPENFLSSGIPSNSFVHYTISLLIFPPKYLPIKFLQNMN